MEPRLDCIKKDVSSRVEAYSIEDLVDSAPHHILQSGMYTYFTSAKFGVCYCCTFRWPPPLHHLLDDIMIYISSSAASQFDIIIRRQCCWLSGSSCLKRPRVLLNGILHGPFSPHCGDLRFVEYRGSCLGR